MGFFKSAYSVLAQRPGGTTQRDVPLDFAAVTDHAEFLGEMGVALDPNNPLYNSEDATAR